jgi:glycosyltransferase involved in cell wall biosynthesis
MESSDDPRADSEVSEAEAPDVSVIMAAHNAARWLPETLSTILSQEGVRFEVVVADDGSTDETREVVQGFGPPVRYFHQENSGGPAGPRNLAVSRARGRYLTIFDHDDRMRPGKLRRSVEILERQPAGSVLFTDYAVIDQEGRVVEPSCLARFQRFREGLVPGGEPGVDILPAATAFYELLHEFFIGNPAVMFHRSAVERLAGPFNPRFDTADDFDLMLRLALAGHDFVFLDEPLHEYRRWPGNITGGTATNIGAVREVFRSLVPELQGELRDHVTARLQRISLAYAWDLSVKGEPRKAVGEYLASFRDRPNLEALRGILRSTAAALATRPRDSKP